MRTRTSSLGSSVAYLRVADILLPVMLPTSDRLHSIYRRLRADYPLLRTHYPSTRYPLICEHTLMSCENEIMKRFSPLLQLRYDTRHSSRNEITYLFGGIRWTSDLQRCRLQWICCFIPAPSVTQLESYSRVPGFPSLRVTLQSGGVTHQASSARVQIEFST